MILGRTTTEGFDISPILFIFSVIKLYTHRKYRKFLSVLLLLEFNAFKLKVEADVFEINVSFILKLELGIH